MERAQVDLSHEELQNCVQPVIDAMNAQQMRGWTIDEVLTATLYMIGSGLKQRGAIIDLNQTVRSALKPFADGYEDSNLAEDWQKNRIRHIDGGH